MLFIHAWVTYADQSLRQNCIEQSSPLVGYTSCPSFEKIVRAKRGTRVKKGYSSRA